MKTLTKPILFIFFTLISMTSVCQTEDDLKSFFEGKMVQVKIDMPATSKGIDIYPTKSNPIDFDEYSRRIKEFGIALYHGDQIMITKVKVKKKHIEFHLGGGGYGTWGDESAHVSSPNVPKSQREKELEDLIDKEENSKKKKDFKKELDQLKKNRRLEQERVNFEAEQTRALKLERIREKAMQSGSRFNIRYDQKVISGDLTPENIVRSLAQYAAFGDQILETTMDADPSMQSEELRKGMLWETVAQKYGVPNNINQEEACGLKIMTCSFKEAGQTIEIKFVEGVVVSYQIKSD